MNPEELASLIAKVTIEARSDGRDAGYMKACVLLRTHATIFASEGQTLRADCMWASAAFLEQMQLEESERFPA